MMKKDTPGRSGKSDKEKGYKKASGKSFRDDKKPSYKRSDKEDERPRKAFNRDDRPKRAGGYEDHGERPKRQFGEKSDKKWEDRPKRAGFNADGERPKRSFGDKQAGKWEDRPKRSFGEDKPKRKWEDKPTRTHTDEGGERPKRTFGEKREGKWEDRPKRAFGEDKPKKKWEDKPTRNTRADEGGERPKRTFGEKREGKWEDRPSRDKTTGGKKFEKKDGKGIGKGKPSFKKREEEKPFPFGERKISGPFREGYKADKGTKPAAAGRKRKTKDEDAAPEKELTLNTYIAHSGVCSRREAAELVKQGKVKVNDELMLDPGYRVQPYDQVTIAGKKLTPQKDRVYILLNKPKDYITTTDDPAGRKTVMELVDNAGVDRLFPVGRLDRQTTGLLLLTNDGDLAQKLSHPSYEIKKVYQVTLDKNLTKAHFEQIVAGVDLEDGLAHVDALAYLDTKNELGLEIHSGRNRIVRRIFESLGYAVEKLDRVMYAGLTKKNLPRGKWRFLQEKEVILLKHFKS